MRGFPPWKVFLVSVLEVWFSCLFSGSNAGRTSDVFVPALPRAQLSGPRAAPTPGGAMSTLQRSAH